MILAAERRRSPIDRCSSASPFDVRRGPQVEGSFEERDCTTLAVMNGRTDEIVDIATTTLPC